MTAIPGPRRRSLRTRDGLRLSALEWEGPEDRTPLLCLSGVARNALDHLAIGNRLAGRRRVVALDYIGHGESERAPEIARYSVEWALRDVLDAMAALHLHRVALLGTSLGGILAMVLGVLRPGCLAAVALNDIGPRVDPGALATVMTVIGTDPGFATEEEATEFLRANLPPLGFTDETWPGMVAHTYARGEDGRLHPRWDTRLAQVIRPDGGGDGGGGAVMDLWPAFRALGHLPLLLAWGEESTLLTRPTVEAMQAERPDMELLLLPGIGHAPPLDRPEILAALDGFLARIG